MCDNKTQLLTKLYQLLKLSRNYTSLLSNTDILFYNYNTEIKEERNLPDYN